MGKRQGRVYVVAKRVPRVRVEILTEEDLHRVRDQIAEEPFNEELNRQIYTHFPIPEEARNLIDFYRQMQRLKPEDWRHLVNLARAYSATGKDSLAVVQLQKLLRTDASLLEVWMDLADCYMRLDKSELALRAFNSAIDIDPSFEKAHLARVNLLIETGEFEEASAAVIFSLACSNLDKRVVELLESLDEFLESRITPPPDLVSQLSGSSV